MDKTDKHDLLAGLTVPTTPGRAGDGYVGPSDPLSVSELESVGGFRLVRLLGRGGMGAVYEAVDPDLGRAVAVKVMLPALAANADAREQFLREARTVAAVKHDHVVTIFRVGEERGSPYLAMELLSGESLADRCRRAPVALGEAVRIAREAAAGLAAIHASGVIHRDVKPDNIWLESPGGRAKLLDFGLARRWEDGPVPTAMAGTLVYMAPEQARGDPVDHRADLFALGVVVFRMLTGRVPFTGGSMKEVVDAIAAGDCPPVRDLNPSVPAELASLVHRLLDKNPHRRPPTAAEVVRELATVEARLMVSGSGVIGSGMTVIVVPNDSRLSPTEIPYARRATRSKTSDPTLTMIPAKPAPPPPPAGGAFARLSAAVVGVALVVAVAAFVATRPAGTAGPPPTESSPTVPDRIPVPPPPTVPVRVPGPPTAPKPRTVQVLFNGTDLEGWHAPPGGPKTVWSVDDGAIVCTPRVGAGDQFLLSDREFDDFDLRLEYRWVQPGGHTTVLIRAHAVAAKEKGKDPVAVGIMVNIGDDEGFPRVHGRDIGNAYRTGALQFLTTRKPRDVVNRPVGEWNDLRVVARRQMLRVEHNGEVTAVADLDQHLDKIGRFPEFARSKGSVALVAHWGPIEYRNVRISAIAPSP